MENNPKKKNIVLFFLKMLLIFILVNALMQFFANIILPAIYFSKYSSDIIIESILSLLVIIVIVLSKNSYIFKEKRTKLFKSLLLGLPMLFIAVLSFLFSKNNIFNSSYEFFQLLGYIIFVLLIGVYEELLCRGWLQNEFIERFGKNKKQVITSIVLSSFIFGAMHITNVFVSQSFFQTSIQILQAMAAGILLGVIYYRTKNIWSVILLHALYDFGVMFSSLNYIKDCTYNTLTTPVAIYYIITSLVIVLFYFIYSMIYLRKSKINDLIEVKEEVTEVDLNKEKKTTMILISISLLMLIVVFVPFKINGLDEYEECYAYEEKTIDEYVLHYPFIKEKQVVKYIKEKKVQKLCDETEIKCDDYIVMKEEYELEIKENRIQNKIEIKNTKTGDVINLDFDYSIYYVIDNVDSFSIGVLSLNNNIEELYYTKIDKILFNNTKSFLEHIKNSFKKYDLPSNIRGGYLTIEGENYNYPFFEDVNGNQFIIDKEDKLYLLK